MSLLRNYFRLPSLLAVVLSTAAAGFGQTTLSLVPGTSPTSLQLTLTAPAGIQVNSLQWTVTYPVAAVTGLTITSGAASTSAAKSVTCTPSTGAYVCVASGMNSNVIGSGVVAGVAVTMAAGATAANIGISSALGASVAATAIPITASGASISTGTAVTVSGLACTPSSLASGAAATCTVTLSAAPAAATAVALASDKTTLTVPASVTVAAGSTTGSFTATAGTITSSATANVTASLNSTSAAASIALTAPAATTLSGLSCGASTLASAGSTVCTLTITPAAPAGGVTIGLANTSTALTVPSSAVIPASATTTTFSITAGTITSAQTATISATLGSTCKSLSIALVAPATVSYVTTDTTTSGAWKGVYGTDGYAIANDGVSYPAYANVNLLGSAPWTWASTSSDPRALQSALTSSRIISAWYSATNFSFDISFTDGKTHQVALYAFDYGAMVPRAETIDVLDAATGAALDCRPISSFSAQGKYIVWNISGHVIVRVTMNAGANAVISGIFFGGTAASGGGGSATVAPSTASLSTGQTQALTATCSDGSGVTWSVSPAIGIVTPTGANTATYSAPASISTTTTVTVTATSTANASMVGKATLTVAPSSIASATFVKTDDTTQGAWKGVYGADGYSIANDSTSYPAYAAVAFTGQQSWTWTTSTTDVRALQSGSGTGRVITGWWSADQFSIDVNLTDGKSHQVALYSLDYGAMVPRSQKVDVLDAITGAVLDTRTQAVFTQGEYLAWNLTGHVTLRVTRTAGANAVVCGIFFGAAGSSGVTPVQVSVTPATATIKAGQSQVITATVTGTTSLTWTVTPTIGTATASGTTATYTAPATVAGPTTVTITATSTADPTKFATSVITVQPSSSSATFVKEDDTTQGTWKGVYGASGYTLAGDATAYPAFVTAGFTGQASWTWATSSTDVRALQNAAGTGRLIAGWYSDTQFSIDLNFTDGKTHQVALYSLDYGAMVQRAATVNVVDAVSGTVLDTRTMSNYTQGVYLVWNVSGHVTLRVIRTSGANAVSCGLFFNN